MRLDLGQGIKVIAEGDTGSSKKLKKFFDELTYFKIIF